MKIFQTFIDNKDYSTFNNYHSDLVTLSHQMIKQMKINGTVFIVIEYWYLKNIRVKNKIKDKESMIQNNIEKKELNTLNNLFKKNNSSFLIKNNIKNNNKMSLIIIRQI